MYILILCRVCRFKETWNRHNLWFESQNLVKKIHTYELQGLWLYLGRPREHWGPAQLRLVRMTPTHLLPSKSCPTLFKQSDVIFHQLVMPWPPRLWGQGNCIRYVRRVELLSDHLPIKNIGQNNVAKLVHHFYGNPISPDILLWCHSIRG